MNFLHNTKYFKTEVEVQRIERSKAEVCFLGRSNVGKSTLINTLCQKKNMAQVSQMPGKTRTINIYEVSAGRWLVDLPGYGFAVGGPKAQDELGGIVESYLKDRQSLQMIYVVVDAVAGPTNLDRMMIDWLQHSGFVYSFVVHKIDKIAVPKLETRKDEILKALGVGDREVFWVSSFKKIGVLDLQRHVAMHLHLNT